MALQAARICHADCVQHCFIQQRQKNGRSSGRVQGPGWTICRSAAKCRAQQIETWGFPLVTTATVFLHLLLVPIILLLLLQVIYYLVPCSVVNSCNHLVLYFYKDRFLPRGSLKLILDLGGPWLPGLRKHWVSSSFCCCFFCVSICYVVFSVFHHFCWSAKPTHIH